MAAAPPRPRLACEDAAAWVKAHKSSLPQTLSQLSAYTPAYQRAIFSELPLETRRAMWREKLMPLTQSGSGLTDEQRAFVAAFSANLEKYLTNDRASGLAAVKRDRLKERAAELFGQQLAAKIFYGIPSRLANLQTKSEGCDCNIADTSADCLGGEFCNIPTGSCPELIFACGWTGFDVCDGFC